MAPWVTSDEVSVRLLGPVDVVRGDDRIDLRGDRPRQLVAYLALQPGTVRGIDGIIDALWPTGSLPVDPRQAVHTYASRLRTALGGNLVVAQNGGYRLAVTPADVDARRFELLVERARDPGCAPSHRITILGQALALWRGPALEGFQDSAWARADARRLEELRATAEEDRAETLIQLGRAADAIADLEAAAGRSPLRERTHSILMTALHRSGRQAEALRLFQQYRRRLATDLGLEPGAEIVGLENEIAAAPARQERLAERPTLSSGRSYTLLEPIAEGAFSVVYRAIQPAVDREVAIKVIRAALADRPDFVRRFEAEAQRVAHLEHPHIVPLYDFWREPGSACLVMRLFHGGTLEDLVADRAMTLDEVVRFVTQIGAALSTAHRAGIVHRDVKPANVFFDGDGNFFLGDFGIAVDGGEPAPDSSSFGSPGYAAPEQLRHEAVGPAADVYGLAIAAFECLAGHSPFHDARTEAELIRRQLHDPLPRLEPLRPELPAGLDEVLARATEKDPAKRHPTVVEFVADLTAALARPSPPGADEPRGRPLTSATRSPYKGLLAFQEADAPDFFGRQALVDRLVSQLNGAEPASRFLAVVGPSGSGKSSVVRAGLLPALRAGAVPGSRSWFVASMVPGNDPFGELETALSRVATESVAGLAAVMAADASGISHAVARVLPPGSDELVLVVDQFEELFTQCPDESTRRRFAIGLVRAVTDAGSRLRVVITVRADFYDRPLRYAALARMIEGTSTLVTPLDASELHAAIEEPAARAGSRFETGLASAMVADVVDHPGALPLLQFTLTELFDRRAGDTITFADYLAVGGISGATGTRAEALYDASSVAERDVTRRLFLRLVAVGEGGTDTRRRVARAELGSTTTVQEVIDRYGAARLLAFDRDPTSRAQTVELAHEALLHAWPRLRGWIDEDREGLALHRHLTTAATAWEASGRDAGELYRGGRLEAATQWAPARHDDLNETERTFLVASQEHHREQQEADRRASRRLRRAVVVASTIAVVAVIAGGLAWRAQRNATASRQHADDAALIAGEQRDVAEAAALDAQRQRQAALDAVSAAATSAMATRAPQFVATEQSLALLLAAEANGRSDDPETLGALQRVLTSTGPHLGFIPIDDLVEVGFDDAGDIVTMSRSAIDVWDGATHQPLRHIELPAPFELGAEGVLHDRVHIDAALVAWPDEGGVVWLADTATGEVTESGITATSGLALDAAGRRLAIADAGGQVTIFEIGRSVPTWTAPGDGLRTIGELALATGLGEAAAAFYTDRVSTPIPTNLSFDATGDRLFVSRGAGVRVLDARTGIEIGFVPAATVTSITGQIPTPLVDDSGRVLLQDFGGVSIADLRTGAATALPVGNPGYGDAFVAAEPVAGGQIAAVRLVGEVSVFDTSGDRIVGPVDAHLGQVYTVEVSPDGRRLLLGGERGLAELAIDGSTLISSTLPRPPDLELVNVTRGVTTVVAGDYRFSQAAGPDAVPSVIWNCQRHGVACERTEAVPRRPGDLFNAPPWLERALLSYDGGPPEGFRLYDPVSGRPVSEPILVEAGHAITSFVPAHRRWIAMTTYDQYALEVRSLPDGAPVATVALDGGSWVIGSAEPERLLVYNLYDGDSLLVDTSSWTIEPSPLPPGEVLDAVFSEDGKWLVTAGSDGAIVLRDGVTFEAVRTFTSDGGTGNDGIGLGFSDDGRHVLSALDGRARLWDVATGSPIGEPIETPGALAWQMVVAGDPLHFATVTDRWIHLWSFDVDGWHALACRAAGRNLTREEWELHGPPGEPYHRTCEQWPAPP